MSRSLSKPMIENDFKQLVLVANAIAVFQMAIKLETADKRRRTAYALALRDLRRIESSIPGNLDRGVAEVQSSKFYNRLGDAVQKFMDSFKDAKPVGRDSKGRFVRIC